MREFGQVRSAFVSLSVTLMTATIVGMLGWIFVDIARHGGFLLSLDYLLQNPLQSGRAGGIAPILVSTILIVSVCIGVALPLGLGAAVLLSEFAPKESSLGGLIRLSLDALAAVPSIVFGLFGNAFFCKTLGLGFSILSGGLTLACMALPLMIRVTEEGLRSLPLDYRLSSAALGISRSASIGRLLLPAALPAILAGLVLSVGRALAETAALIFTSGYVDRMPESVMDSGRSLSVHIYDLSMNVSGGDHNAYRSTVILVLLLLCAHSIFSWLGRRVFAREVIAS